MLRNIVSTFILSLSFSIITFGSTLENYLIPSPQKITYEKIGRSSVNSNIMYSQLEDAIASINLINMEGAFTVHSFEGDVRISLAIKPQDLKDQAYTLEIQPNKIELIGQNEAALFYAKQTLKQLIAYSKFENSPLPCIKIKDWPNFERRGYMLDISRDKVPTMQTLHQIIDYLAAWKINEFQLYTEHTFAYKNHKVVWENASPLTAEEIKELEIYCKKRFIDLVPNQNSFGHMERWLEHDEYLDLAECPEDCKTIWGNRKRHSLNPTNPKSLELMQELYAELLPNFSSKYFNIGCDETVELGCGLSAKECDKKGKGEVYLEFVKKLNAEVNKHDKQAQFWGDIILNHPKLIPDIPKNMTALVWGYDSDFAFKKKLPKFKKAGLDYYVCPGTSTWRSLIGRNKDAFENLKIAAIYGKENNAKGYLNTNWGDYGHWQPLSVCHPAMMVGAAYAWKYDETIPKKLELLLNKYVYIDATGNTAKAILKLGNAYTKVGIPEGNANAFHLMLHRYKWTMKGQYQTKRLTKDGLTRADVEIDNALAILQNAHPQSSDSSIIMEELIQAAALAKHAINLGKARLDAKDQATDNIPAAKKQLLYNELAPLIDNHKELWIKRNRPGGLKESSEKLEGILDYYKTQ